MMTQSALPSRPFPLFEALRRSRLSARLIVTNLVILTILLVAVLSVLPGREELRADSKVTLQSVAGLLAAQLGAGENGEVGQQGNLRYAISPVATGANRPGVTDTLEVAAENWLSVQIELPDDRRLTLMQRIDTSVVLLARDRVLQLFIVAALISCGVCAALARAISRPISSLATVTEHALVMRNPMQLRIPPVWRGDEIGELFQALRHMVATFHERTESNERFAADVAHEIKNPLASLRSAVSTLRIMKREEQRETLIRIIEHDVRRLDRLVSDISTASRLEVDLVSEEHELFDIAGLLRSLSAQLRPLASDAGVSVVTEFPSGPVEFRGIADRISQVVSNLFSNALSLCDAGDAIRIWCRQRDGCIILVVEDTGPGIPVEALERIFERFYSERPAEQFGEHSGLGLAISRQIVEAHGGLIWAENVVPGDEDNGSEPMGARFIVRFLCEGQFASSATLDAERI